MGAGEIGGSRDLLGVWWQYFGDTARPERKWVVRVPRGHVHRPRGPQLTQVYYVACVVAGTQNGCTASWGQVRSQQQEVQTDDKLPEVTQQPTDGPSTQ